MLHAQTKGKKPFRRTLSFVLMAALLVSVMSIGLSGVVLAEDADLAQSANNYTNEQTDIGSTTPVRTSEGYDSASATWVDAVYYDYYTDRESNGADWLKPKHVGTGFNGAEDDWYPFDRFNAAISSYAGSHNMTYPLYFGNFCNTVQRKYNGQGKEYVDSAYPFTIQEKSDHSGDETVINETHGGPYAKMISGLYHYNYFINNSNALEAYNNNGKSGYNYSVMGLADRSLDSSGNIYSGGVKMPYFDASWLRSNSMGKSIKSYFPFREYDEDGVSTYIFNSEGAEDNVFFNWESYQNPRSIAYGKGNSYGVKDGLYDFMGEGYQSGYGIFPFNNAKEGNKGNNELDYGFGIKINMDFRVPEGGKINGKDVRFDYSGDDDLWVYLSEYDNSGNLTNSELVLDLGGNHKKATGSINFATMKSYADNTAFADSNLNFKGDTVYVDPGDWNNVVIYAWDEGKSGIWLETTKQGSYYPFNISQFDGRTKFTCLEYKENWNGRRSKTDGDEAHGKNLDCILHSQLGNVCYANNPNWIEPKYPAEDGTKYKGLAGVSYNAGSKETVIHGGQKLDSDKTYHLTVFYMERGLIESNCMMKFTMTPVKNNLAVKKTIHTDDGAGKSLNTGIQSAVKAQNLDFTNNVGGSDKDSYQLSDQGSRDFTSYNTGSSVIVTEKKKSTGIVWKKTDWKVTDKNHNTTLKSGTYTASTPNAATDAFVLQDSQVATNTARLQVDFDNYPSIGGTVNIDKTVKDDASNTDSFTFRFRVDLNGGKNYQAYPLTIVKKTGSQTSSSTLVDGKFTMTQQDTVSIAGLPEGATYILEEETAEGYQAVSAFEGTVSVADRDIDVENIAMTSSCELEIKKVISSGGVKTPYSGSLFTFKAEGLAPASYESGKTSISTQGQSQEVSETDSRGVAKFTPEDEFLSFHKPGVYLYKLTETRLNASSTTGSTRASTYADDITMDQRAYVAKITVVSQGAGLDITDLKYYAYDGTTINPSTFSTEGEAIAEFTNTVKTGSVKVIKKDHQNSGPSDNTAFPLSGVSFNIYKVSGKDASLDSGVAIGEPKSTNSDGIVEFKGLDLYQTTEGRYDGEMEYQWYALSEITTKAGYVKEKTVYYFTLPMVDASSGTLKYDVEFNYVNGAIKNPLTAGFGYGALPFIGGAFVLISILALGAYYVFNRRKVRRPAHMRK